MDIPNEYLSSRQNMNQPKLISLLIWPIPKAVFAILIAIFLISCSSSQEAQKLNFILFFTDELQLEDLGAYGGAIPTPNFDKLAQDGLLFTKAYTAASMCTPSRFAVLTGQFPGRCQSESFLISNPIDAPYSIAWNTWLVPDQITLPRMLSESGYFTGMAGKWHVGQIPEGTVMPKMSSQDEPTDPAVQEKLKQQQDIYQVLVKDHGGFDYAASVVWGNFDGQPITALNFHNFPWMTKGAVEFLEKAAQRENPFFLYFAPTAIHGPNHVQDLDKDVTQTLGGVDPTVLDYQIDRNQLKERLSSLSANVKHRHAGMAQLDHQLGIIRHKLSDLSLSDNTVIIFMSDHNIEPAKATSYEKGNHIPMIVYWPGKTMGQECAALVQNVDVMPTLLQLAGIPLPENLVLDGINFSSLFEDPQQQLRSALFTENGYTRSVTDGSMKYIALRYPLSLVNQMENGLIDYVPSYVKAWPQAHSAIAMQAYPHYFDQDQLYDLKADPYELHNLANQERYTDTIQQLREVLVKHLQTFDHPFSLEPIPFLGSDAYQDLQTRNKAFDLYSIPWLRRDHGGIQWPPSQQ